MENTEDIVELDDNTVPSVDIISSYHTNINY